MGLFGSSPQKKLERARGLQARKDWYAAWQIYRELAAEPARLAGGELSEAVEGSRACRRAMIALRLQEAEALHQAGDLEGARDRCLTASELAGEDLDQDDIRETLQRINAPRRRLAPTGELRGAVETDLLPEPDETVTPAPSPLDRAPEEPAPRSDAELFGDDPEGLFEIYLAPVDPAAAEVFRSLGPDFRFGYLALSQGEGRRALEFFDRLDWNTILDPRARLERAHALLLAGRAEESLAELDALAPGGEGGDAGERRRYLRIEALRALGRLEDAVAAAEALAEAHAEPDPLTESLLAWTLIEAGRAEEAAERLAPWTTAGPVPEEILIPAAQAAQALSRSAEEMRLLELLIRQRLERSVLAESEPEFPIEAGRRLLALMEETGRDPDEIRTLVLHLIDYDLERADSYRQLLLELDAPA